ncbi:DUF2927 domain-containing protein [Cognatiyoonia sp.]|uniref:DUF2927 domain-containing protein n=1 Tax=Cognatiyoonia sp. TaxID=2211652 RepID=UPI003F69CF05
MAWLSQALSLRPFGPLNRLRDQFLPPNSLIARRSGIAALCLLVACAPVNNDPSAVTRAANTIQTLPPLKAFGASTVRPASRSNTEIAQDFMDLSFRMENGRRLPILTRFDGAITVRFETVPSPSLTNDLTALLTRLRGEAGISIMRTDAYTANITIETIPQRQLQLAVPHASCFVVPNVTSWADFQRNRRTKALDWATLTHRDTATIFIPAEATPQEQRDCLHEELAQALGPLNDLYRLPDSVFNDDNIHPVLTGFDILILKAYYAPELANGMTAGQVSNRINGILARLNPAGELQRSERPRQTSPEWMDAMQTALLRGSALARRQRAAERAIALGERQGWSGPRQGFAHYASGRLLIRSDPEAALSAFERADSFYQASPDMEIHRAHISAQRAAFALARGDVEGTLSITDDAIPVAYRHQDAALMSTLMMFKAEALDMRGNAQAAETVRLDSLGWARYGFGSNRNVQARLAEIAALRPF